MAPISEQTLKSEDSSSIDPSLKNSEHITKRSKSNKPHYKFDLQDDLNFDPDDGMNYEPNQLLKHALYRHETIIKVDVGQLQSMTFDDVQDIRDKVSHIFAPQKVKMICKRAERKYANGY